MNPKKVVKMPLRRPPPRPRPSASSLRARAATAEETYDEEDYESGEEPNMKFSHALIVVLVLHLVAVGGVFAFNWMKAGQTAKDKSAAAQSEPSEPAPAAAKSAALDGWTGKTHTVAAGDTLTRIASLHGVTIEAIEKENGITTYSMIRVGQVLKIPGASAPAVAKKPEPAAPKPVAAKPATSDAAAKQTFINTKTEAAPVKATVIAAPSKAPVAASSSAGSSTPTAGDDVYVVVKGDNPYSIARKLEVSYNDLIKVNNIEDPTKIQIGQKLKVPKK